MVTVIKKGADKKSISTVFKNYPEDPKVEFLTLIDFVGLSS